MTKDVKLDQRRLRRLVRHFEMQATRNLENCINRVRRKMLTQDLRNLRGSIKLRNGLIPGGHANLLRNAVHPRGLQIFHLAPQVYLLLAMQKGRAFSSKE